MEFFQQYIPEGRLYGWFLGVWKLWTSDIQNLAGLRLILLEISYQIWVGLQEPSWSFVWETCLTYKALTTSKVGLQKPYYNKYMYIGTGIGMINWKENGYDRTFPIHTPYAWCTTPNWPTYWSPMQWEVAASQRNSTMIAEGQHCASWTKFRSM